MSHPTPEIPLHVAVDVEAAVVVSASRWVDTAVLAAALGIREDMEAALGTRDMAAVSAVRAVMVAAMAVDSAVARDSAAAER
jgi:hypothetical protein